MNLFQAIAAGYALYEEQKGIVERANDLEVGEEDVFPLLRINALVIKGKDKKRYTLEEVVVRRTT